MNVLSALLPAADGMALDTERVECVWCVGSLHVVDNQGTGTRRSREMASSAKA